PWEMARVSWFRCGKRLVVLPFIRPPTITPRRWRPPWVLLLSSFNTLPRWWRGGGRSWCTHPTACETFATARKDSYVLGPHGTWKWILAKKGIDERATLSRDHELYEFLRNIRQARIKHPRLRSAHLTLAQRKYYAKVKGRPVGVWSTPRPEEISPAELRSSRSVGALLL